MHSLSLMIIPVGYTIYLAFPHPYQTTLIQFTLCISTIIMVIALFVCTKRCLSARSVCIVVWSFYQLKGIIYNMAKTHGAFESWGTM
jgi:hypothetical protein